MTELIWLPVKRAINQLEREKRLPPDGVDPEDVLSTIGLWKSALIPPDRAGSHSSPYLPLVYQAFERQRLASFALTFDDFTSLAVDILECGMPIYSA
jgi:hypothetical protein